MAITTTSIPTVADAHTPGAWWVQDNTGDGRGQLRVDSDHGALAVFGSGSFVDEESRANARLFKSAPKLLAALRLVRDGLGCQCVTGPAPRSTYPSSNGPVECAPCECWSCEAAREADAALASINE